jgi:hypothetical protein
MENGGNRVVLVYQNVVRKLLAGREVLRTGLF